ncbi:MAG TPA: flagellar basal body-associated FliL family protein [Dyella sp.]|uniref:flagellar basal body-associated FliL family protein n=1 Tax=Dyella sp. TaxID=1869338 RepID=UPI002B51D259|nr:flagellar basal body-associated FliL family protein [Dyella sp.]HTV86110.1 flagellar basal body-associated FliL family protein [Dyella sp.]
MASAEEIQEENAAGKKRGSRMPLMVGVMAVLLLGGGGAWWFTGHGQKAANAEAAAAKAPELFVPLDPAFVVNFQDQDSTRYLQVGVTVMTHDPAAVQAVKDSDPVIRNALVMLFSSQTYAGLSNTAGKVKLQNQALDAVRKVVADKIGKPDVDALYFTSFVMQ